MNDFLTDLLWMLALLGGYAITAITVSVCAMAAYLKWEEKRRG